MAGLSLTAAVIAATIAAQTPRVDGKADYVVIRAGAVETATGETHRPGMIVIEDGKVRHAGRPIEVPSTARVIDAPDQTALPGLIDVRTRYRFPGTGRSGIHGRRSAAEDVVDAAREVSFDALLEAGFTHAAFYPSGSGIPGHASLYRTAPIASENGDPLLVDGRSWLRITFANTASDKPALRGALDKARAEIEKVRKAREEWEKKQAEAKAEQEKKDAPKPPAPPSPPPPPDKPPQPAPAADPPPAPKPEEAAKPAAPEPFKPPAIDPDVQPLVDALEKKDGVRLVFELGSASDLVHLDDALERFPEVSGRYVLDAGTTSDFHEVVPALGERKATVALPPVVGYLPFSLERNCLAADLARAGCDVVLVPRSDSPSSFEDVLIHAAELVRCGLARDAALRALTIAPARFLGIDARTGSLEKGKDADVILVRGDPFAPGARVERVFIAGREVWNRKDRD